MPDDYIVLSPLWGKRVQQMWNKLRTVRGGGSVTIVNKEDSLTIAGAVPGNPPRSPRGSSNLLILVTLTVTAGTGDPDDFTYSLFDRSDGTTPIYGSDGTTPVTGETPLFRPLDTVVAAAGTIGVWCVNDAATAGDGVLLFANEVYTTGPCESTAEAPALF